jgi:hypothetical protein
MPKPLILAMPADLVSVLQGRTLDFETVDGLRVDIRLMTADEYEAYLRVNANGPDDLPMPSRQRIEELTRGLPKDL